MAASTDRRSPSSKSRRSPEEKLVASLITLMETGCTPWRRPWDGDSGGHHVNLFSGRRYRGGNPALLSFGMQLRGSFLPYWCGFAEAKARGLAPRRGSQAVHVLRPQLLVPQAGPPDGNRSTCRSQVNGAGSHVNPEEAPCDGTAAVARLVLVRPMPVFNAADLEGEGLAELIRVRRASAASERRPARERLLGAEQVLQGWSVPVICGGDRACYLPDADRIHLPDRGAFHSEAAYLATWAHEAIHSTGHTSRLGRDLSGAMGAGDGRGRSYAREELVAELGAVLLGDRLEIGSDTANHAAYLSHWIALLRESPRLLLKLLSEARQAADLISPEADPAVPSPEPSSPPASGD